MSQAFIILVSASPLKSQAHLTAIRFLEELKKLNVTVRSIFFYQDAVLVANRFSTPPSDEPLLREHWKDLSNALNVELQTCVAASYRRGVLDKEAALEQEVNTINLDESFKMTGLGQLAAAMSDTSVNLVHFK